MERRPDLAQCSEAVRCEQQHEQRGAEIDIARQQPDPKRDSHQSDRERGDEFEGEGGQERHAQRRRGAPTEFALDPVERPALLLDAAKPHDHGKAAGELNQIVRQAAEFTRRGIRPVAGVHPDQDHEQRNQGQRKCHDQRAQPIDREDPGPQHHGHHHRGDRGRDDRAEVVVEIVQAGGREHGHLPGIRSPAQRTFGELRPKTGLLPDRMAHRDRSDRPARPGPKQRADSPDNRRLPPSGGSGGDGGDGPGEGLGDQNEGDGPDDAERHDDGKGADASRAKARFEQSTAEAPKRGHRLIAGSKSCAAGREAGLTRLRKIQ